MKMYLTFDTRIILLISCLLQGLAGLRLIKVSIPAYKLRGEGALLECQYELNGRRHGTNADRVIYNGHRRGGGGGGGGGHDHDMNYVDNVEEEPMRPVYRRMRRTASYQQQQQQQPMAQAQQQPQSYQYHYQQQQQQQQQYDSQQYRPYQQQPRAQPGSGSSSSSSSSALSSSSSSYYYQQREREREREEQRQRENQQQQQQQQLQQQHSGYFRPPYQTQQQQQSHSNHGSSIYRGSAGTSAGGGYGRQVVREDSFADSSEHDTDHNNGGDNEDGNEDDERDRDRDRRPHQIDNDNENDENDDDDDGEDNDNDDEGTTTRGRRTEALYAIKWYKDNDEFYRFVPKATPPKTSYRMDGVRVSEEHSDATRVLLRGLTLNSTGVYRCEVSAEAPNFSSVQGEGRMDIVFLPRDGPHIRGQHLQYQIGETLNLNCTSGKSHPASHLQWFINDQVVGDGQYLVHYNDTVHKHGLITSTLGLQLIVDAKHFSKGAMRVKCLASISPVLWKGDKESVLQRRTGIIDNREAMLLVRSGAKSLHSTIIRRDSLLLHTLLIAILPLCLLYSFTEFGRWQWQRQWQHNHHHHHHHQHHQHHHQQHDHLQHSQRLVEI